MIKQLRHALAYDEIWIPSDIESNKCVFVTPEVTGVMIL